MQPNDPGSDPYPAGGAAQRPVGGRTPPPPDPAGRTRQGHGPLGELGADPAAGTAGERPVEPQRIKRTISSALWIGLIVGAILLILLIVFIVENSRTVKIDLIFGDVNTALAIGLLLSAVIGALLVAVPGTIRILQLRKEIKRRMR